MIVAIQIVEQKQNYLTDTTALMLAMATSNLPKRRDLVFQKLQSKTLPLLQHFSMLCLLNAWYNCTSSTQKSLWNYVRRLKNYLHTLYFAHKILLYWSEITYRLDPFNISFVFRCFKQKLSLVVFWKKIEEYQRSQEKNSCWVVGTHTKAVSPKI